MAALGGASLPYIPDGRSLVRSSALWTLSKFGDWLVEQQAMCAEERDAAAALRQHPQRQQQQGFR
jgi:hypothetical protein